MTEVWRRVENSGKLTDSVTLPGVPVAAQVDENDMPQFPARLKHEQKMYPAIMKCLTNILNAPKSVDSHGARVWQTDRANIIGYEGMKPDLVVTVDVAAADLSSIIAPWEVKVKRPTRKDFGQLYGYVQALIAKQPARRKFVGVLESLVHCHVIILERDARGEWTYQRSVPMTIQDVISWFRYYVIAGSDYSPHFPKFSSDLGGLKERLGDPAFCAVGMFPLPAILDNSAAVAKGRWINPDWNRDNIDPEHKCMVVKRFLPRVDNKTMERPVKDEIEIFIRIEELRKTGLHATGPESRAKGDKFIPDLLFYSLDFQEFGILPVGTPLHPEQRRDDWPSILNNVLSALEWIHSHDIVHRDVRWSNIVHYVDHAVLVDFGESVDMRPDLLGDTSDLDPAESRRLLRRQVYSGGLISCPPRLLGLLDHKYTPRPADDLHAFVLLGNMLVWPKLWTGFNPKDVLDKNSSLTRKLKRFWKEMEVNRVWKPFINAAVGREYATLEKMGAELCLFLGSRGLDPVGEEGGESDWVLESRAGSLGTSNDSFGDLYDDYEEEEDEENEEDEEDEDDEEDEEDEE